MPSKLWKKRAQIRPAFESLESRRLLTGWTEIEPNDSLELANDLAFQSVASLPALARAQVIGQAVDNNSDFYRIRAYGGDAFDIRVELRESPGSRLDFYLRDALGNEILDELIGTRFEEQVTFEVAPDEGGIYYLELDRGRYGTEAEYSLTVMRSRGASLEPGRDTSNHLPERAEETPFRFGDGYAYADLLGSIKPHLSDPADSSNWDHDLFRLGHRETGDSIRVEGFAPEWSDANPIVEVVRDSGEVLSTFRLDDPTTEVLIQESGIYDLRVSATTPGGPDSQYVLSLELYEVTAPYVASIDGIPETTTPSADLISEFGLEFSEPVRPMRWNGPVGDLREAGVDAVFGTADDVVVSTIGHWDGDTKVNVSIVDAWGQKQSLTAGKYQYSLPAEVVDRAGNLNASFHREFVVAELPDNSLLESEPNNTRADANVLSFRIKQDEPNTLESELAVGLTGRCGSDALDTCEDQWKFQARAGDFLSVTTLGYDDAPTPTITLYAKTASDSEPQRIDTLDYLVHEFDGRLIRDLYVEQDATFYISVNGFAPYFDLQYSTQVELRREFRPEFPAIASIESLPGDDATADRLIDRFTINLTGAVSTESFDEEGVKVIAAGDDGQFDTADDLSISTTSRLVHPPWQIDIEFDDGPLAPGDYRIEFSNLVADHDGNRLDADSDGSEGGTFTRMFTVPPLLPNRVLESNSRARLEFRQDTAGTELYRADVGYGSIGDPSDVDWWEFDVRAGDQVVVDGTSTAGSTLGAGIGVAVKFFALGDDGVSIEELNEEQFLGGRAGACSARAIAEDTQTWLVKVWQHEPDQIGDYEIYLHVARTSQLEGDFPLRNGTPRYSETVSFSAGNGAAVADLAGLLTSDADRDLWDLGHLQPKSWITAIASVPDWSSVSPVARIHRLSSSGDEILEPPIDLNLTEPFTSFTSIEGGRYALEISAGGISPTLNTGFDAAYLAQVRITDETPPEIVDTSGLPAAFPKFPEPLSTFSATFSETIDTDSITPESYELRYAGLDRRFETADDELMTLTAIALPDMRSIEFRVDAGPLIPGFYRFTLNGNVKDLSGNGLDANGDGETGGEFAHEFRVLLPNVPLTLERPYNDLFTGFTPLVFGEVDQQTGWQRTERGFGTIETDDDIDWWSINVDQDDIVDIHLVDYSADPGLELKVFRFDPESDSLVELATSERRPSMSIVRRLALPSPGMYFLRVQAAGDYEYYRYILDAQKNHWHQVETEEIQSSPTTDVAKEVSFEQGDGSRHAFVAGSGYGRDDDDYFALGYLLPGQTVHLDLTGGGEPVKGDTNLLLSRLYGSPTPAPVPPADELTDPNRFQATVNQPGYYYARISTGLAAWITNEPPPQYLLEITIDDTTPLSIVDLIGIPGQGESSPDFISDFTIEFNEIPQSNALTSDRFHLTNAGPDQTFATADDIRYPITATQELVNGYRTRFVSIDIPERPLADGLYHLQIDDLITDLAGNPLDGNNDGVGGGNYARGFIIDAVAEGAVFEGPTNNTFMSATALPLIEDSLGTGWTKSPVASGVFEQHADQDWWVFPVKKGDQLDVFAQTDQSARWSIEVGYWDAEQNSTTVLDGYGDPNQVGFFSQRAIRLAPIVAPTDGNYFVRMMNREGFGSNSVTNNRYDLSLAIQSETSINPEGTSPDLDEESIESLVFTRIDGESVATTSGFLLANELLPLDRDGYEIVGVQSGQPISIQVTTASWSHLETLATVIGPCGDQLEHAVLSSDSDELSLIARADGNYRLQLNAFGGAAMDSHYRLSVRVDGELPMAELFIPDVSIDAPMLLDPRSEFGISWTTMNNGSVSPQSEWVERVYFVESGSETEPVLLGTFEYADRLAPGQSIRRSEFVSADHKDLEGKRGHFLIETAVNDDALGEDSMTRSVALTESIFGELILPDPDEPRVEIDADQAASLHQFLIADAQTTVRFVGGWQVLEPLSIGDMLIHQISTGAHAVYFFNALPETNPVLPEDVDRNGNVTPRDALLVINRLGQSSVIGNGQPTDMGALEHYRYFDTTGDSVISPRDALAVINRIARQESGSSLAVGERALATVAGPNVNLADDDHDELAEQIDFLIPKLF